MFGRKEKMKDASEERKTIESAPSAPATDRFSDRMALAESMISHHDGLYTLDPDPAAIEIENPFEPLDVQKGYESELRRFFDYSIEYYPEFDRPLTVSQLGNWTSFVDLHDKTVEEKFPIDRDIRAYITAFRLTVQRNYRRFIRRRRTDQLILMMVLFVPFAFWALLPELRPAGAPAGFAGLWPFLSSQGPGQTLMASIAVMYLGSFAALLYNLSTSRQVLASTLHATAGDLKAKVQRRINSLHQGYNHSVKAVNEAELVSGVDDSQWIDDAKFWAQLALWKPKRIEYIEKFYQSEMQRTRVHAFRWRVGMRVLGWVLVAISVIAASAIGLFAGDPMSLTLAGLVAALSFAHYQIILSKHYLVEITDIRQFIGQNDWKRFSDINFDEDFADIIRRDKMRIRQEKSRGTGMVGRAA
ncbi:MAG: hypothetical protein AAFX52_02800 [Pseudomonadota bacterium]